MTIAPVDPDLRKNLAKEAEGLLANTAFTLAVKTLRMQWYAELTMIGVKRRRERQLVGMLAALDAIPQMLDHLVTSEVMAQRSQNARRN